MAEEISAEARKGSFDSSPRLRNWAVCERCGCRLKRYIDYLKAGEFEVGQVQRVLVSHPGYYHLYTYHTETLTPIFITAKCQRCGFERKITDPALTLEYLQSVKERKEAVGLFV